MPPDINKFTAVSATGLAGQGLLAVAKEQDPRDGTTSSFVAGFAEVEVDLETGKYHIVDYLGVADVGIVIHPRALGGQVLGRSTLGMGHALGQKWVYDQHYGLPLAKRFYQNKPPRFSTFQQLATGSRGPRRSGDAGRRARYRRAPGRRRMRVSVKRPLHALGDEIFRRAPVTMDVLSVAGIRPARKWTA